MIAARATPAQSARALAATDYGICAALILFSFLIRFPLYTDTPFISDSADYLRAAQKGFWTEYLDLRSVGLPGFLQRYLHDAEFKQRPWAVMNRDNDHASMRHFHVPAAFYPHAVAASAGGGDRAHRMIAGAIGALLVGILFLWLRHAGVHWFIALAIPGTTALLPQMAVTAAIVSGHGLYLVWAVSFLFAFATALARESPRWWAAGVVFLAAAFATLELSFMLVAPAILLMAVSSDARRRFWRILRARGWWYTPVWFVATVFAIWPAGVYKGSYALSYGTFAFQILKRADTYFAGASPWTVLMRITSGSPALLAVYGIFLVLALYLAIRARGGNFTLTLLLGYTLIALSQGRQNKFSNPTYVAQFLLPMWTLTALTLDELYRITRSRGGRVGVLFLAGIVSAVAAVVCAPKLPHANAEAELTGRRIAAAVSALRQQYPGGTRFLVPDHYEPLALYLPEHQFEPVDTRTALKPRFGTASGSYVLLDRSMFTFEQFEEHLGAFTFRPLIAGHADSFWIASNPVR